MSDEYIVTTRAQLVLEIEKALRPVLAEATSVCQKAIDVAKDRVDVACVLHLDNLTLRTALMRLLDSTEHAKHHCGDDADDCPVVFARSVLRGPVRQ